MSRNVALRTGMWASTLVLLVASLGFALPASPARAAETFTVNTTADGDDGQCEPLADGDCTLREAIAAANDQPGADLIAFAIPGAGPHTIAPTSALPDVTDPVTIDGYTQPGAAENTLAAGTNAVLLIELRGNQAGGQVHGLTLRAADSVVKGLVITRFRRGIRVEGPNATGITIAGNFLGTDPTGTVAQGNLADGIIAHGRQTTIGGPTPAARNLISGNGADGISIGGNARSTDVIGNLIGAAADGASPLGNGEDGVVVGDNARGSRILDNVIFDNRLLGINLRGGSENPRGVTANDRLDDDGGANHLQNFPLITSAVVDGGETTIKGVLRSRPHRTYLIQFFNNPAGNQHEGLTSLGELEVETNRRGVARFTFVPAAGPPVVASDGITATATSLGSDETSEFSLPRDVAAA